MSCRLALSRLPSAVFFLLPCVRYAAHMLLWYELALLIWHDPLLLAGLICSVSLSVWCSAVCFRVSRLQSLLWRFHRPFSLPLLMLWFYNCPARSFSLRLYVLPVLRLGVFCSFLGFLLVLVAFLLPLLSLGLGWQYLGFWVHFPWWWAFFWV